MKKQIFSFIFTSAWGLCPIFAAPDQNGSVIDEYIDDSGNGPTAYINGDLVVGESPDANVGVNTTDAYFTGDVNVDGAFEADGYKIENKVYSYDYTAPKPPELITLGLFRSRYPIRITVSDVGNAMGGGVEFYIAPGHIGSGAVTNRIAIYSMGDSDDYPNSEDDYRWLLKKQGDHHYYLAVEHLGGNQSSGNHDATVDFVIMGRGFVLNEGSEPTLVTDYEQATTRKYLYASDANGGNIGIGTTTPSAELQVVSYNEIGLKVHGGKAGTHIAEFERTADGTNGKVSISASYASPQIRFDPQDTVGTIWAVGARELGQNTEDVFQIGVGHIGTDAKLTINADGNVGIGVETPTSTLHVVEGGGYAKTSDFNNGGWYIKKGATDGSAISNFRNGNDTSVFSVHANGTVKVGSTTDPGDLIVSGAIILEAPAGDIPEYVSGQ